MTAEPQSRPTQQAEGVRGRLVTLVLVGTVVIAALSVLAEGLMLADQRGRVEDSALPAADRAVIGQIEQLRFETAARGRAKARAAAQALSRYSIRDRDAGIATIPIQRAFDWMLENQSVAPPLGGQTHAAGGTTGVEP